MPLLERKSQLLYLPCCFAWNHNEMSTFTPNFFPWHIILRHASTVYNKYGHVLTKHQKVPTLNFLALWDKKSWTKIVTFLIKLFFTRIFQEHQKVFPVLNFSVLCEPKLFLRNSLCFPYAYSFSIRQTFAFATPKKPLRIFWNYETKSLLHFLFETSLYVLPKFS